MDAVRQGDVLLTPIREPKVKGKEIATGRVVLALGEVTGHAHTVESDGVALFEMQDGQRMLWVEAPTTVQHQEHRFADAEVLQRGWYAVTSQVEEDPLSGIRRVTD